MPPYKVSIAWQKIWVYDLSFRCIMFLKRRNLLKIIYNPLYQNVHSSQKACSYLNTGLIMSLLLC